ncbi:MULTISPECIES: hypothetical protein [Acidobacteriaceae]|uniref:hypothetical protein n=1 Tax=Acidobacteriaceae TaxID=204434 RepID=UPI00131B7A8E|nr:MULTISPECIES: hypothetical protein [Acidobacteriaceae]MDW5267851.1 hypothetical protein [Edaphobacter sp.]
MDFDDSLACFFLIFFIFVACAFFFQRIRWKKRKRRGKWNLGFYPTAASAGNALHALQIFAQPKVRYVLQEKLSEDEEQDDEGDADDPSMRLKGQLRRIRRGEPVGDLEVPLP